MGRRSNDSGLPAGGSAAPTLPDDERRVRKKGYAQPSLKAYGRLVDVTRFGGSQMLDTGGNLQSPP